jgi:hypothetical protein
MSLKETVHINPSRHPLYVIAVPFLALAICLGLLLFLKIGNPFNVQAMPDTATVTTLPNPADVSGCGVMTVSVMANNVISLYGADVRISFDTSKLEVVGNGPYTGTQIQNGNIISDSGFFLYKDANNITGKIRFVATNMNPAPPFSGSGTLFRIGFHAKSTGSSTLVFTRVELANREGGFLTVTPVNGSVNSGGPVSSTLSINRLNASDVRLTWTASPQAAYYSLYRGTQPYFTPSGSALITTTATSFDDLGILGDPNTQHYYVVTPTCPDGLHGQVSNRVGEYDFPLNSEDSSNYNDLALVLEMPWIVDATSLANYIGPSVLQVQRFNPANQTFQVYAIGDPATNFPLSQGEFVMVVTDESAPATTALVGGVPEPGSLAYNLVSGSPPQYNFLSLPLDLDELTSASAVAGDIGAGVVQVIRYRVDTQAFQIYVPGDSATDFPLAIGEPFGLLLTSGAPTIWP